MICQFFANGFEELEAIAPIDLLRRAGVEAQTVSLEKSRTVTGSHSIPITCDITASELDLTQCDGVILPGGPGCTALSRHPQALAAIELAVQQGLLLAAICAAPSVLGQLGYLKGKRACCFPGYEADLLGAEAIPEPVVTDGNIITAQGAGCAVEFSLALISYLVSSEKAAELARQIQCP